MPLNKIKPEYGRSISRPIKTNFMQKLGCKALDVRIGNSMIVVTYEKDGIKKFVPLKGGSPLENQLATKFFEAI